MQDRFYPARDESKSSPNRSEKIFYSSFSNGVATLFSGGTHRTTPLQAAQLILGGTSLIPLKEWEGLNGKPGVYHSHAHSHSYLFMLIPSEEKHSPQSYPPTDRDKVIHLAECIAAFAGAQERFP